MGTKVKNRIKTDKMSEVYKELEHLQEIDLYYKDNNLWFAEGIA